MIQSIRFLPRNDDPFVYWHKIPPTNDLVLGMERSCPETTDRVVLNVLRAIGYTPTIPPSRHRSKRVLKKLQQRQKAIYDRKPRQLSMKKSTFDNLF